MTTSRRGFLQLLGLGAVFVAAPRRIWQVGVQLAPLQLPEDSPLIAYYRDLASGKLCTATGLDFTPAANTLFQSQAVDHHLELAAKLMRLPPEQAVLHPEYARYRQEAKRFNFGSPFGVTPDNWRELIERAALL